MSISDFEDLGIISDSEHDEGTSEEAKGALMTPAIPAIPLGERRDRPHPPWEGHRDKLVGIVDMGRQAALSHNRVCIKIDRLTNEAFLLVMVFVSLSRIYQPQWHVSCRRY